MRFTKLEYGQRIEQAVDFQSEDPAFAGTMRVTWTLQPVEDGTLVSVRAEDVPDGILPDDHAAGMRASLENLARFVESGANQGGSHEK
ncbi:MAG TPA: SRPBCC domain-containing protein [Candidatus Kapabacteria bacterium]|nr:SRPBCC domain-containing protein [Candidatus Kapabacteria bacterium]